MDHSLFLSRMVTESIKGKNGNRQKKVDGHLKWSLTLPAWREMNVQHRLKGDWVSSNIRGPIRTLTAKPTHLHFDATARNSHSYQFTKGYLLFKAGSFQSDCSLTCSLPLELDSHVVLTWVGSGNV
jgi:hypothetical protein